VERSAIRIAAHAEGAKGSNRKERKELREGREKGRHDILKVGNHARGGVKIRASERELQTQVATQEKNQKRL